MLSAAGGSSRPHLHAAEEAGTALAWRRAFRAGQQRGGENKGPVSDYEPESDWKISGAYDGKPGSWIFFPIKV